MHIFNFVGSFLKRLRTGAHQDPVRDWLALLTVSAIVLAGIIVWNLWAFDTIAGGGTIGSPSDEVTTTLSGPSLDAVHTIFVNRATEHMKYVTGTYRYADPSQ